MASREGPIIQLSAYEDLAQISERLVRAAGLATAQATVDKIMDGIDLLGGMPYLGPAHHDEFLASRGYRKLVLGRYVAVYRVDDGIATALRVFRIQGDYKYVE